MIPQNAESVVENLGHVISMSREYAKNLEAFIGNAVSALEGVLRQLDANKMQAFIESANRFVEDEPKRREAYRKTSERLVDYGWFVGGEIPARLFLKLVNCVSAEKPQTETIDQVMSAFVKWRFDSIIQTIVARYPDRAQIVQEAFEAHKQQRFAIAIPALLAQAEGIWSTEVGSLFFSKERRKQLKEIDSAFWNEMTCQILVESSIEIDTRPRELRRSNDSCYGPLNRHAILHGFDVDYANELNGLRTLCFLDYVVEIAPKVRDELNEVPN